MLPETMTSWDKFSAEIKEKWVKMDLTRQESWPLTYRARTDQIQNYQAQIAAFYHAKKCSAGDTKKSYTMYTVSIEFCDNLISMKYEKIYGILIPSLSTETCRWHSAPIENKIIDETRSATITMASAFFKLDRIIVKMNTSLFTLHLQVPETFCT
jgi:hypothetical protein